MYVITSIFDFNNIGDNDVKLLTKTHKYDSFNDSNKVEVLYVCSGKFLIF